MRLRARTDANQAEIVKILREFGCSVLVLSQMGHGVPDLLVARNGKYIGLMEVKDGSKCKSERRLTPDEEKFIEQWKAPVYVVESTDGALDIVSKSDEGNTMGN